MFAFCHTSYLANLDYVEHIEALRLTVHGVELPVNRSYRQGLLEPFTCYLGGHGDGGDPLSQNRRCTAAGSAAIDGGRIIRGFASAAQSLRRALRHRGRAVSHSYPGAFVIAAGLLPIPIDLLLNLWLFRLDAKPCGFFLLAAISTHHMAIALIDALWMLLRVPQNTFAWSVVAVLGFALTLTGCYLLFGRQMRKLSQVKLHQGRRVGTRLRAEECTLHRGKVRWPHGLQL